MAASCLVVFVAYCATLFALYGTVDLHSISRTFDGPFGAAGSRLCYLLFALIGYSVCQLVSAFVDRSLVAVVVGLLASVGFLFLVVELSSGIPWSPHDRLRGAAFFITLLTLVCLTCLGASHAAFCRSDLARPTSRFPKAATVLAIGAVVMLLADVTFRL